MKVGRHFLFGMTVISILVILALVVTTGGQVQAQGNSGKGGDQGNGTGGNQGGGGGNDPKETKTPNGGQEAPNANAKITLCHATGSATNPYVEITVSNQGATHGHEGHPGDIIPAPANGCPYPSTGPAATLGTSAPVSPLAAPASPVANIPLPPPPHIVIAPAPQANPDTCPQQILFHTFRDGNLEIYRLDGMEGTAGARLYNLSNSDAMDWRPSLAPDHGRVVFESGRRGNVELYYGDGEGKEQTRLTYSRADNINPMFGPDNKTVIFQSKRNSNWDIFGIDITTGVERQLTTDPYDDINPYWSPDPNWIVFESNRTGNFNVLLLNVSTGNEFQVTNTPVDETSPSWSPNGEQLAYLSNLKGAVELFVSDVTGNNPRQVTVVGETGSYGWSPDGTRLAYQSERNGNLDVYSYDLRTGIEYRLTDYIGPDSAPTWDCGGQHVVFSSTRDVGDANLLQVNWLGGSQSNLTVNTATDTWPEWSPSKETASQGY